MDRAEEILREQLKIDKAVGFGKLMWELHKNTLKKCMQIYAEEQLLPHNASQQSLLLSDLEKWLNRKENNTYYSLPVGHVIERFKSLNFE